MSIFHKELKVHFHYRKNKSLEKLRKVLNHCPTNHITLYNYILKHLD